MTLSATMPRTLLARCVLQGLLLGFLLGLLGCRTESSETVHSKSGRESAAIAERTIAHRHESTQRETVLFWHFWGGRDKPVVDDVIRRFNASQDRYRVRGIAMPGSNLDLKFFLSVTGGEPPDLMNHDDPIVADWAHRGAILPLDEIASGEELARLNDWLFPAARSLGSYNDRMYALVNGLDIRALYYNQTMLREAGIEPPTTLDDLDQLAERFLVEDENQLKQVGYLPDPRRIWAWTVVHGGRFFDPSAATPEEQITLDSPENLAVLKWMASYSKRLGPDRIASFRTGDQALTGASFPLLADRRYAAIMDGQWRVRDLTEASKASELSALQTGKATDEYGVIPLPLPTGGLKNAGWVNGNFFIIPRGANQPAGAWEFMKFWIGFGENSFAESGVNEKNWPGGNDVNLAAMRANEAAETAAQGGWIPVSEAVTQAPRFQLFLAEQPLFAPFVELAASPNQHPTPAIPSASFYYREAISAAQDVMYRGADPEQRLNQAAERVRRQYRSALESVGTGFSNAESSSNGFSNTQASNIDANSTAANN